MDEIAGLDFSSARPSPSTLARAGFTFALGYLKPLVNGQPSTMELRPADVTGYPAAAVQLGAVWETAANRALSGATGGLADAAAARARAAAIGYPASAVVFAAVDFAVTAAQLPAVHAYLDAFCDNVGHPGGSYGSYTLVEARAARRPGEWLWQTAAWSGGLLSPHAHLYQRAAPSGHWPVIPGTDENVLCHPLPLLRATPGPTPGGFLMTLSDAQQQELHDRVMGFLRQRWYVTNQDGTITPVPEGTPGALPAHALDTLDGDYLVQRIAQGNDPQAIAAAVVKAIQALPAPQAEQVADLVIVKLGQRINTPPA